MDPEEQPNVSAEDVSNHVEANGHVPDAAMPYAEMPEGMDENRDVRAENVTLSQGGARDIEATTVSITQGGAAQVSAEQMSVSQGGVAIARADHLTVNEGGSAFAVISDQATINEGANVLVLVAGEVSGDARPLLDWRSALGLAAGLVIAWRLVRRIL